MVKMMRPTGGNVSPAPTASRAKATVTLPAAKSVPSTSLSDYLTLIYGEKKIGKTSMCAHFPDAIYLMLEPGGKALSVYQTPVITSWAEFLGYLEALEQDDQFRTVIVDTVDQAYELCFEYSCKRMAINHPNDENDYGKSWKEIKKEFIAGMTRLFRLQKGVIMLGHAEIGDVKSRSGNSYNQVRPAMAKQAMGFLTAVVDTWAYYGYEDDQRVLVLRGDEFINAGTRVEQNFRTTGGQPVEKILMGRSSKEAYDNFVAAFQNKLKTAAPPSAVPDEKPTTVRIKKR